MKKILTIIVTLSLFVISFGAVYPVLSTETMQLHLKDGSIIKGIWTTFYDDLFVFSTPYGTLRVSIDDIRYLQVDPEYVVSEEYSPGLIFSDGQWQEGSVQSYHRGKLNVEIRGGLLRIDISEIAAIIVEMTPKEYLPDDRTSSGEPGERILHNVGEVNFYMRLAPASTFPIGIYDSSYATVDHDFWIAETQVTYVLWYTVRQWALNNGYTFVNAGREGGDRDLDGGNVGGEPSGRKNEPVTMVSWYDSIVWCNALSEYLGYDPVYTIGGEIVRSATGIHHNTVVIAENRNGFRLTTSDEWELAARYKGSDSSHGAIEYPVGSGNYWTPGNYASGATADYNNGAATQAAGWYGAWDGSGNTTKTQDVGQKPPGGNGLGLFDMSGNVWEWCFTQSGSGRVLRGGSWYFAAYGLQVGFVFSYFPGFVNYFNGLRFLRTHF